MQFGSTHQVHRYAQANGLEVVVEGTAAFNRRRRYGPDWFQVVAVRTRNGGIIRVGMFPKGGSLRSELSEHSP
jgi:hypothetical protein